MHNRNQTKSINKINQSNSTTNQNHGRFQYLQDWYLSSILIKLVLLGEGRVGKTSIVLRYVNNKFEDDQKSTVQATYLQKDVKLSDKTLTLSIVHSPYFTNLLVGYSV
jgi:GTPase SAR1 family protein